MISMERNPRRRASRSMAKSLLPTVVVRSTAASSNSSSSAVIVGMSAVFLPKLFGTAAVRSDGVRPLSAAKRVKLLSPDNTVRILVG